MAAELRGILPGVEIAPDPEPEAQPIVIVETERGVTVEVAGSRRAFEDPERRCSERASQAGVFIALMLDPLRLPPSPPAQPPKSTPPPAPSAPAAPPPVPEAGPEARQVFAVGPAFLLAPSSGLGETPLGLGLGARWRWGSALALSSGFSYLSTTTLHYDRAEARERLLALDVGASWGVARASWAAGGELSAVLAPANVGGEHLATTHSAWRVEWGARVAFWGEWWLARRIGLFVSEFALVWPRPLELNVGGIGEVGHTPAFWLGTQLGLVWRVD